MLPADRRNAYGFPAVYTLNSLNWVCAVICIVYVVWYTMLLLLYIKLGQ